VTDAATRHCHCQQTGQGHLHRCRPLLLLLLLALLLLLLLLLAGQSAAGGLLKA
jgi:hypothetical protein